MASATKSPIVGYKIAVRSGANLNQQEIQVSVDNDGKPIMQRQYEVASKRLNRAIRKARLLRMGNNNVMLFGIRADGTHFPVSLKQVKWEVPKGFGCNSWPIVEPADVVKQAQVMRAYQKVMADEIRKEA
jgi:hypothetical protein